MPFLPPPDTTRYAPKNFWIRRRASTLPCRSSLPRRIFNPIRPVVWSAGTATTKSGWRSFAHWFLPFRTTPWPLRFISIRNTRFATTMASRRITHTSGRFFRRSITSTRPEIWTRYRMMFLVFMTKNPSSCSRITPVPLTPPGNATVVSSVSVSSIRKRQRSWHYLRRHDCSSISFSVPIWTNLPTKWITIFTATVILPNRSATSWISTWMICCISTHSWSIASATITFPPWVQWVKVSAVFMYFLFWRHILTRRRPCPVSSWWRIRRFICIRSFKRLPARFCTACPRRIRWSFPRTRRIWSLISHPNRSRRSFWMKNITQPCARRPTSIRFSMTSATLPTIWWTSALFSSSRASRTATGFRFSSRNTTPKSTTKTASSSASRSFRSTAVRTSRHMPT